MESKKNRKLKPNKKSKPYSKKIKKEKPELCDYECGQKASYYFKAPDKWCCSLSYNGCRTSRRQRSKTLSSDQYFENIYHKLCDHGCGQEAKFKTKSGKFRCSKANSSCPEIVKRKPITWNKISSNNLSVEIINKPQKIVHSHMVEVFSGICDYGCEQVAKFKSSSGRLCCEKSHLSCKNVRKKNSERMKINNPMKNPETIQKNFRNHGRQKTGPEKYLENLFRELNLEILYIGDGRKYINGRSPDFIILNTKKLIEVYDSSFNYCGEIRGDEWVEKRRSQLHGYDTLFIDFYKLGGIKNYEKLVKIIMEFYGF